MKVHVESKDDIVEAKTDSRGRIYLGSEYADKRAQVAVLEVSEPDDAD